MADFQFTVRVRVPNPMVSNIHVSVGQEVYSFGGESGRYLNVHVFNTVSLKSTKVFPRDDTCYKDNREVPCMRWDHSGVLIDNVVYIWGGRMKDFTRNNVLYAFDVDTHTWINTEVSGTVPEARSNHSACVSGNVMFIHGGVTQHGPMTRTNDTYKLDTSTMVWSLIETRGTAPPASDHSATIIGTKMFVYGGTWGNSDYPTIRVFDTETNNWLSTPSAQLLPRGRYKPSAFAYYGELYISGTDTDDVLGPWGETEKDFLGMTPVRNLWKINPETLSWKKVTPKVNGPYGQYQFSMIENGCCVVGDRVVIFGFNAEESIDGSDLFAYILDFSPISPTSLKTLCKMAVLQYGLEQSELPHNIREELAAMTMTDDVNSSLEDDSEIL